VSHDREEKVHSGGQEAWHSEHGEVNNGEEPLGSADDRGGQSGRTVRGRKVYEGEPRR